MNRLKIGSLLTYLVDNSKVLLCILFFASGETGVLRFSVFIVIDELVDFSDISVVACVISKATYTGQIAINPMTWRTSNNFFIFLFLFDDLMIQKYNVGLRLKGHHDVKNGQPLITLLVWLSNAFASVHPENADEIVGVYWSPKKDAKIEIFKRDNRYYGRSIWVASMRKDSKNPDETLKNREVLGIELLTGFSFNDDSYTDGKIYDPESGKTYDCKMTLTDKILKVRGYIGISLFGRTETFERIK